MASSNVIDMIEKLIRLSTNNPSPEEASLAALKACELIQKFSVPLGAEVKIVQDREWTPPSSDFMDMVDEILKGTRAAYNAQDEVRDWQPADVGGSPSAPTQGLMIQDRELLNREEAFRRQMQRAWQAIRAERKRFEAIVHEARVKRHMDFWDDEHPKPWGDK